MSQKLTERKWLHFPQFKFLVERNHFLELVILSIFLNYISITFSYNFRYIFWYQGGFIFLRGRHKDSFQWFGICSFTANESYSRIHIETKVEINDVKEKKREKELTREKKRKGKEKERKSRYYLIWCDLIYFDLIWTELIRLD